MNRPLSLWDAARFWGRLGLVSFGGPAGQIALLHGELVVRKRWLSERRFLHALNYCLLLPGPEATQLATYLGWLIHGTRGGLIAGGLFLLPSVLVMLGLSAIYALWGQLPLLASVFWALKPVVVAIVVQAAWRVGRRTLATPFLLAIAGGAFLALVSGKVPYPLVVGAAALAGLLANRSRPGWLETPRPRGPSTTVSTFATGSTSLTAPPPDAVAPPSAPSPEVRPLHDDSTPTPAHARPSRNRLLRALLLSGLALALPLATLGWLNGWDGPLATMARFFTRVALLSFGGAYAVLPYVAQGAVDTFGWLSAHQMIDGLALGETTPGPLIMVVAFVGFLGGWNQTSSLPFATLAALVVVWFTFLPSFAFILAGGPLVEASRDNRTLTGPLTAISAAVTGVIASLAVRFARPVLWPTGVDGGRMAGAEALDGAALALVVVALLLLLRARWGVLPLIGAAAGIGALKALAGF